MRHLHLAIVGFGTVGRWLAAAIDRRRTWLATACGVAVSLVSVATRRDGFLHCKAGFDIAALLDRAAAGQPLADYPGATRWRTVTEGLAATGGEKKRARVICSGTGGLGRVQQHWKMDENDSGSHLVLNTD